MHKTHRIIARLYKIQCIFVTFAYRGRIVWNLTADNNTWLYLIKGQPYIWSSVYSVITYQFVINNNKTSNDSRRIFHPFCHWKSFQKNSPNPILYCRENRWFMHGGVLEVYTKWCQAVFVSTGWTNNRFRTRKKTIVLSIALF